MKLSCLPVSLYPDLSSGARTAGDWFRFAAELGLDGADLSVMHITSRQPDYLADLRRQASDAGVQIVMLATYSDFTHPDAAERARQIDDIRAWIAAAQHLGVSYLRTTAGQNHPQVEREMGLQWAAEGLLACQIDARAAGVELLYENHTRGASWTLNDFTQPADRFLDLVQRTAATDFRLLFDTANNLALDDDPVAVLQAVKTRVSAVHLADIRRTGAFEPVVLGTGVSPIPQLLEILVRDGFDGWLSIEEASRTGQEGFRRAVAFADHAWQGAGGRARNRRLG